MTTTSYDMIDVLRARGIVGDNFIRHSGESVEVLKSQAFAWDQYNQGKELHAQALPTQV